MSDMTLADGTIIALYDYAAARAAGTLDNVGRGRFIGPACFDWDRERKFPHWVYVRANGVMSPGPSVSTHPNPGFPRIPQARWGACCHAGPHVCSQCGEKAFYEIHGMADGECQYCWYRG